MATKLDHTCSCGDVFHAEADDHAGLGIVRMQYMAFKEDHAQCGNPRAVNPTVNPTQRLVLSDQQMADLVQRVAEAMQYPYVTMPASTGTFPTTSSTPVTGTANITGTLAVAAQQVASLTATNLYGSGGTGGGAGKVTHWDAQGNPVASPTSPGFTHSSTNGMPASTTAGASIRTPNYDRLLLERLKELEKSMLYSLGPNDVPMFTDKEKKGMAEALWAEANQVNQPKRKGILKRGK